jgi:hypothetical protein
MAKPERINSVPDTEAGPKFKIKKNLTPPLFKFVEDETRYVKATSVIYIGKEQEVKSGEKKKEAAHLMDVINLETGEPGVIIVSAVVLSVLNESFPNNSYVDKGFAITKRSKAPGKNYNGYVVEELEL